jgi:hypothetical protein
VTAAFGQKKAPPQPDEIPLLYRPWIQSANMLGHCTST